MRFNTPLYEATFLRRPIEFLAEAVVSESANKVLLRCPNMGQLTGCAVLGSRIWYSNATYQKHLKTWEIVEVDGGALVCVNEDKIQELVLEAVLNKQIDSLSQYEYARLGGVDENDNYVDLILENGTESCYINIEQVVACTPSGQGYFPERLNAGIAKCQQLMELKAQGKEVALLFVATHNGMESLAPANHIDPLYEKILKEAMELGVETFAYRCDISLDAITLTTPIPVLLSENYFSS